MIGTAILCVSFVLLIYLWATRRPSNFPPGPPSLPIVGSIPFIPRKLVHVAMVKDWRPKYGPIVGLIGGVNRRAVAVCGAREVLEVLRREEFQGRPDGPFFRERSFGERLGVFFSEGPFWVEQRRFTIRHLRDFGFGKKSMEGFIMDEIEDTVREIKQDSIFETTGFFNISTLNVLWGMIAGKRYSRDDAELKIILAKLARSFRAGSPAGGLMAAFPILNRIVPRLTGYNFFIDSLLEMQSFFRKAITEHKQTQDENNPRDLIDVYLREINLQNKNPETSFTENGLITVCLDLFIAGGETTTSTLGFSLLYMILYPRVQEAVQKELDEVVGRDRRPSLDDRPRLHYVEAVMTELLRVCSIAPMTPPHRVTKDTTLGGYVIPKDSMLLVNLYSVFQDKEHWGDPEVFRPERFLNADGKFVKDEWMIPFGAGKRICLGETLARSSVFLFFTTLLQEFNFTIPEGDPKPSTVPLSGFTIAPQPFRVKATQRA